MTLNRHPTLPLYLASFYFAIMALGVKLLTDGDGGAGGPLPELLGPHDLPAVQVVFFRSLVPALLLLPAAGKALALEGERIRVHLPVLILRGVAGGSAMWLYFAAIDRIALSSAVLLIHVAPLWAAVLAFLFLKEPIPRRIYWAFPVAFAGVWLVVGSGIRIEGEFLGFGMALLAAALAGVAYTSVRSLTGHVSAPVIVFIFSAVTCVGVLPWVWASFQPPSDVEWGLLAVTGLSAGVAQLGMTVGYRWNSTSRASTVELATVGFTAILAVVLLGERMTPAELVGLGLLLAGVASASSNIPEPAAGAVGK